MITNKWITGTEDISDALDLRRAVFVEEQGVAPDREEDENDPLSQHLILYDGGAPVATGRIYHDGRSFRIGRCCVAKESRGQGIGDLLVKLLLLKVFEYGPSAVRLHAQTQAEGWYARYGFVQDGKVFMEEGIPHVEMWVDKNTLVFPSACGHERRFEDFFEDRTDEIKR